MALPRLKKKNIIKCDIWIKRTVKKIRETYIIRNDARIMGLKPRLSKIIGIITKNLTWLDENY